MVAAGVVTIGGMATGAVATGAVAAGVVAGVVAGGCWLAWHGVPQDFSLDACPLPLLTLLGLLEPEPLLLEPLPLLPELSRPSPRGAGVDDLEPPVSPPRPWGTLPRPASPPLVLPPWPPPPPPEPPLPPESPPRVVPWLVALELAGDALWVLGPAGAELCWVGPTPTAP